jgi:hypothetical protein
MPVLINFVLFQLAWFACVLGAANGLPWVGPLVVAGVVAVHLARVPDRRAESALLLVAAMLGTLFDSTLVTAGLLSYPDGNWLASMAPYWIIAMWIGFATTLNVSLNWLKGRPAIAMIFGAIGGPLAFVAGQKLGAVSFVEPAQALAALALGWGLLMPLLMTIATRLDGWRPGVGRRMLAATAGGADRV